jgi:hypothetical protein
MKESKAMSYTKALVLLIAVLAMNALATPAAQAFKLVLSNTAKTGHPHEHGRIIDSSAKHPSGADGSPVFTAGEGFGGVTCATANAEGTAAGTAERILLTPSYSACTDSFGRTVDVSTNSCQFEYYATSETSSDIFTGQVDIVNCGGSAIETKITSAGGVVVCTVKIGTQTFGPVHYENMTKDKPTDVTVTETANNVSSTTSGGFFNCGIGNGEHKSGTIASNYTLTARSTADPPEDLDVKFAK